MRKFKIDRLSSLVQEAPFTYRRLLLLLACVLLSSTSFSERRDEYTEFDCSFSEASFASVILAVDQLSHCFYVTSRKQDREVIAAILEEEGSYQVVVQPGKTGEDQVSISISRRRGQTIAALWHTHGARGRAREYFSPTDTKLANRMQVPFYLTDPSGVITRFDPGDRVIRQFKLHGSLPTGSAKGAKIGRI